MLILASWVLGIALQGCPYGEKECPGPGGCSVPAHRCFAEGARLVRDAIGIILTDDDFSDFRRDLENMNRRAALKKFHKDLLERYDDLLEKDESLLSAAKRIEELLKNPKYQEWLNRENGLEGIRQFAERMNKLVQQSERLQKPIEETRARLKPMAGHIQDNRDLQQRADAILAKGARQVGNAIREVLDSSNSNTANLRNSLEGQTAKEALERLLRHGQALGHGGKNLLLARIR